MKSIGRNDLCHCGSGKKYKKCCLDRTMQERRLAEGFVPLEVQAQIRQQLDQQKRLRDEGNFLNHIQTEYRGHRARAVFNRIYFRPLEETYHEFLIVVLQLTLGRDWYESQIALDACERHFVMQCFEKYYEWQKKNFVEANKIKDKLWSAVPDGWSKTLILLAHDVYSLQHTDHLPGRLVDRLKSRDQYQGARYEIGVAALFARLGCKINFLDANGGDRQKHCEFIATHEATGISIAVEAKSRHREGVIHAPGTRDDDKALRGDIRRLINRALKQNPGDQPFVIFVDLNSPLTPAVAFEKKPWLRDIKQIMNNFPISETNPDPCNGIFVTNFSYHYQGSEDADSGEYLAVLPMHAKHPWPNPAFLDLLQEALAGYGNVPHLE